MSLSFALLFSYLRLTEQKGRKVKVTEQQVVKLHYSYAKIVVVLP
jgi:hypothetical protein